MHVLVGCLTRRYFVGENEKDLCSQSIASRCQACVLGSRKIFAAIRLDLFFSCMARANARTMSLCEPTQRGNSKRENRQKRSKEGWQGMGRPCLHFFSTSVQSPQVAKAARFRQGGASPGQGATSAASGGWGAATADAQGDYCAVL